MNKNMSAPSRSEVRLRLRADGSVQLLTSAVEMGQGTHATLAQLVADALDVPTDQVDVPLPDTARAPYDFKTAGSRTTFTMSVAIRDAATRLQDRLRRLAAEAWSCDPSEVTADGAMVRSTHHGEQWSPKQVMEAVALTSVEVEGVYQSEAVTLDENGQGESSEHWHQGATAVEIEVDRETGRIEIVRCHAACYAGKVVSASRVRQQNEGGTIFATGQALFEALGYDDGRLLDTNLAEYMIPSLLDAPSHLTSAALESPGPTPEIHGVGEMVVPTLAPAVANALYAATGVRIRDLPLTPEAVLRALEAADAPAATRPEGAPGDYEEARR